MSQAEHGFTKMYTQKLVLILQQIYQSSLPVTSEDFLICDECFWHFIYSVIICTHWLSGTGPHEKMFGTRSWHGPWLRARHFPIWPDLTCQLISILSKHRARDKILGKCFLKELTAKCKQSGESELKQQKAI